MSIEEVSAERFAQLFHHYHEALADDSGNACCRTSDAWADVPPSEKTDDRRRALALLEVEVLPERNATHPDDISRSPAKRSGAAERIAIRASHSLYDFLMKSL